jgi:glycine cleavage system H protein
MEIPENVLYTSEHEWVRVEGDRATVGITDYAQDQLGDVVYVELPVEGDRVEAGKAFGVIESVKAVSDLYAPLSGEVREVNAELSDHPEWVNQDPYGKAWMIVIAVEGGQDLQGLLDAKAYTDLVAEEKG